MLPIGKRSEVELRKGVKIIDAKGKTLLPGLLDAHAHATQFEWFPASLAAGMTTMRDAANEPEFIVLVREAIKNGRAPLAPRLVLAGYIDSGENALGVMRANTPDEARALLHKYKQNGFEQIVIYQSLKPELVKVVTDEAHRSEMTVTGHVPSKTNIYRAIENGFDQINHINFAVRAMLPKDFKPTRVDAGSSAEAGLKSADIVLKVGEANVNSAPGFVKLIRPLRAGQKVALTVLRGGEQQAVNVTPEARPPARNKS